MDLITWVPIFLIVYSIAFGYYLFLRDTLKHVKKVNQLLNEAEAIVKKNKDD